MSLRKKYDRVQLALFTYTEARLIVHVHYVTQVVSGYTALSNPFTAKGEFEWTNKSDLSNEI